MDNHSSDESVFKSEIHDFQNGAAETVNYIESKMEDSDVTAPMGDRFSGQEENSETGSACINKSISDETGTLFEVDDTVGSDMKTDNNEGKNMESVSLDCISSQSTTLSDGAMSINKEPAISYLGGEAAYEEYGENHCDSDTLQENAIPSKTTMIMLDDEEDEEERHERFLRIDTVEKNFGDGRNESGEKVSALKRRMKKEGSTSSSTTSSSVVLPKNARLVFRNLPMDYTTKQIEELLQGKLPPGVLLGEFPAIIEGRAVVEVTPSNSAEQVARLLHDIMIGDCKISVRKLITVDTADIVPTSASTPSSTAPASIETAVQATCDHEGCTSLVMQGDVHTQCCSHSICFASGVFDPASCPHCLSVHARASAGELQARRLWRNRIQRIRKKRLQWVSEEVRIRFPHPDAPPRGGAVTDTGIPESTDPATQASSGTTPTDGLAPDDSNPVTVEGGGDDAKASLSRVRDRSAERKRRAAEIAELGSLAVSTKLEMQGRTKGKEYRITINNIAYGYCLKEMLKMLQDVAGPVVFLMPRFGSLVVEFETPEAATTCHQSLDKTTFMNRKLCITLHGEAGRGQQQQTVPTSPTAGDSSSNLKVLSAGEAVEPTQSADLGKISTGLQARLSMVTDPVVSSDSLIGSVAPTSVKDRLLMPNASTETFGFASDILESLNITLPIVKELSVSNLNERATSADVRELFSVAGSVMGVQYDRIRGSAVVEMRHPVEALQAISLLHAQFYHNKPLTVRLYRANETIQQGGSTPTFPRGLQTIGKRLSIDKKMMAALQAGLTTSLQPTKQRPQKMTALEKRLQNNVPLPAKRPQMGGKVAQRNMNGSTPGVNYQNNSNMGQQKPNMRQQKQNNVMGQPQKISTTILSNASARPGGPQGSASGGCVPFSPPKPDHARGAVGQNSKRGGRRLKRQAVSETDFGNAAKRKNPYWGDYRGPNATGNSANNPVANESNFQNSAPNSGPKFSSNYGQGNNSGNNSNYGTLNRYTSSTSSSAPMGQQYSSSGTSNDWNTGNSSNWNENYSNWNWQQPTTGDTAAYGGGGGGSSSSTATSSYGRTAPTGYTDNTSTGGYSAPNASYAGGAARSYSNTSARHNIATASYGSSSSAPVAGYGGSTAPATASYGSSAHAGYGVDGPSSSYSNAPPGGGGGAYSSASGYYDSRGAPEAIGTGGAQPTAWEGQPTAKVPKYNTDGSFAGFS